MRKQLIVLLSLTFLILFQGYGQQVYINELMFKPGPFVSNDPCQSLLDITFPSSGREYIELYNPDCNNNIDISGWLLASKTATTGGMGSCIGGSFCFPPGTIIPAGGFLTIGGGDETCNGCAFSYNSGSVDIKLSNYYPSDYLCVCDDGQNYSGVWFLANFEGWVALYEPSGTTHAAVYWASNEFNIYSVGNEFGFNPCKPTAYTGGYLNSATEISANGEPIIYLGTGSSVNMGNTYSRIPDGGDFQSNIAPSIGSTRALHCNGGNCKSCGTLSLTAFQDTCSMGKGRLILEVPVTISSPAPYHYSVSGPSGYTNTFTTSTNPFTITGLQSGQYSVTVTDTQSPPAITTEDVFIGDVPNMTINSVVSNDTCDIGIGYISLDVTGGVSPYSFIWSNSPGDTPNNTGLHAGTYLVTVSGPGGVCINTLSESVINVGNIVASLTSENPSCFGYHDGSIQVDIEEGTPPFQFDWSDGNSGQVITGLSAGTYTVTITSADNCQKTLTITLVEPDELLATINNIISVCEGESNGSAFVTATGGTPPYDYNWSDGTQFAQLSDVQAGLYTVTITDDNECTATSTVEILSIPTPNVNFAADITNACAPATIHFSNFSDSGTYLWDFGNGITSSATNPIYTYPSTGIFNVSLTVINSGCPNSLVINNYIQVNQKPVADFHPSSTVAEEGDAVIMFFDMSSGATSWLWNFGLPGQTSDIQNPTYTFTAAGNYNVCLIVTNEWSCTDTICKKILIRPFISLYVPSAFSPNRDGKNDYFMPFWLNVNPTDFTMEIYDRWGELVFSAKGITHARWDGKYHFGDKISEKVPLGTYVYIIKAMFESYPKFFEGTVTVFY